MIYFEGINS